MSNYGEFLDAVKRDDVNSVSKFLSIHPDFFDVSSTTWQENPLQVACNHGSHRVAKVIGKWYPQFARFKNREGCTALHLASSKGDLPIVKVLLEIDSEVCLKKNKLSMNPLHIAIRNGHDEVIGALIAACPQSIGTVTSQRDTVLLLAAKHFRLNAFVVLLKEIQNREQDHLLHRKDREGNNVLHIAVSNKFVEIVKLLLPLNSTSRALVRVNSLNKKGLTALDLCYQSCVNITTQDIGRILREAGALEGRSLPVGAHVIKETIETKNVILVVLGVVTGAAFTTVCNLPSPFLKDHHAEGRVFHSGDMVAGQLPPIFYLMVFNTAILLVCMCGIAVLLWSLPFRPVVLFVTITVGIVYALLVSNIVPKFLFRAGTHSILSSHLVGLLAIVFICCGAITYFTFFYLCLIIKWVIKKTVQSYRLGARISSRNKGLPY
ncbi:hypothetical protein P3X46_023636 [Hevea brasiliensis]|uniref:PGG domain-containing protein n=1 Tax=Hevea brasiliensis TaxID=3981 RepID=A0ABQ9LBK3_HEVBR|nr:ankyrin repeat-containing protein BDA1-like [Hevea brasiliensis]KAJ9164018.1 hypothetical protein P3X46_023636 [Hevea brasiliensis]